MRWGLGFGLGLGLDCFWYFVTLIPNPTRRLISRRLFCRIQRRGGSKEPRWGKSVAGSRWFSMESAGNVTSKCRPFSNGRVSFLSHARSSTPDAYKYHFILSSVRSRSLLYFLSDRHRLPNEWLHYPCT